MKLVLLTIGLLSLAFAGTCASQSPFLNKNGESCSLCGKTPDQYKDCDDIQHAN